MICEPVNSTPEIVSKRDLAARLGVKPSAISNYIARGKLLCRSVSDLGPDELVLAERACGRIELFARLPVEDNAGACQRCAVARAVELRDVRRPRHPEPIHDPGSCRRSDTERLVMRTK